MGELSKRVISAICAGPLIAGLFYFLPFGFFFLLVLIITVMALWELVVMSATQEKYLIVILAAAGSGPLYFKSFSLFLAWILCAAAFYIILKSLRESRSNEEINREILQGIVSLLIGSLFLVLPLFYFYLLKEQGNLLLVLLLFSIWSSDIFAYFIGKGFGKRLLVPKISPKKTWEGLFGAVLGSTLPLVLLGGFAGIGIQHRIVAGIFIGLLGQTGDIFESAGKRFSGTKDSSSLIPGHGGILDRIDSFIFSAPFFYHYLAGIRG